MKKTLFLAILFALLSNFALAQFAIINDKDGFVNVRKEGEISNNIIETLKTGTIVYALEPASANWDWTTIVYKGTKMGVVAYDRLKFIQEETTELKRTVQKNNELVLKMHPYQITIKSEKFDAKNNNITKNKEGFILKINEKEVFGTDGTMPQTQYKSIVILQGSKKLDFPKSEYENLYNVDLENTFAYYNTKEKKLYITSSNSDAAGYYNILWVFENGKLIKKEIAIPTY